MMILNLLINEAQAAPQVSINTSPFEAILQASLIV